jgi:hypothetical protein
MATTLNSETLLTEAGFTPEEIAQWKTAYGAKFDTVVTKMSAQLEQASREREEAVAAHEKFTKDYQDIFLPQLKKTTQDSLEAEGRAAAAEARLKKAQEAYGLTTEEDTVRAPGSGQQQSAAAPDFNQEFTNLRKGAGSLISQMNRINNESQKLFGKLPENLDSLAEKAALETKMGRNTSLYEMWEKESGATSRREQMSAEVKAQERAAMEADIRKKIVEENGHNPNLISGRPSRFSSYEPSAQGKDQAWKYNNGMRKSANAPWRDFAAKKVTTALTGGSN